MSKYPGPFWHEKYMFLNAITIILGILMLGIVIPNIFTHPKNSTMIWILGMSAYILILGLKVLLIWFIEKKEKNKS